MADTSTEPTSNDSTNLQTWTPMSIDLTNGAPPRLIATGKPNCNPSFPDNFFRSARWCPDGSVALAQGEDRSIQVVPVRLPGPSPDVERGELGDLAPTSVFTQAAPILDTVWFPSASSTEPSTYCFVTSVRECPVKLLDASDGRLRASYKIVDHRERFIAPHCLSFSSTATHLYCGFENAIEIFDVQQPGEGVRLSTTPSRKSKDGMKGIISSLAFCPDYSGLFACGTLSGALALYSESTGEHPLTFLDGPTSAIMQVQFNPTQPHLLYASQRRSDEILCWDIRNSTDPYAVIRTVRRSAKGTNQKLRFDIDPFGKWLVAGDENGKVSIFDLAAEGSEPKLEFQGHDDAIGSTSFHPFLPYLLSVSGSRHFHSTPIDIADTSDSDSSSSEDEQRPESLHWQDLDRGFIENASNDNVTAQDHIDVWQPLPVSGRPVMDRQRGSRLAARLHRQRRQPFTKDATMKLWEFGSVAS